MNEARALTPRVTEIAGVWRRIFAFLVDGLILGAVGGGIGLIAFDRLMALGDWGRAVGFAVALVYFGLMDSKLSGGQTFGKQLLGIKVVTANAAPLSVGASALRAAIFCVPYFLNGASIGPSTELLGLDGLLVFGVGGSIVYLLLFNRRTRQSLHDLAVGAYVVRYETGDSVRPAERTWPVHFGVVAVILVAALILPLLTLGLANSDGLSELSSIQQGLLMQPGVRHAMVSLGVNKAVRSSQGATTAHVFSARIVYARRIADFAPLAASAVQVILNRDPSIQGEDEIAITIVYGYDIGIASAWRSRSFALSPKQWQQQISASPTPL